MRKIFLVFITLWLIIPAIHAQKVGLVLSGGGAKGMTHIGIIRALEENNIPIDYISKRIFPLPNFSIFVFHSKIH